MLKIASLAALLFLIPAAWAQSPASNLPSPASGVQNGSQQKQDAANQQKSETDERGTDKSPLIVHVQNSDQAQEQANWETDYNERRAADKRIASLTIAGIVVGAVQATALFITFIVIAFVAVRQLRAYIYPSLIQLKKFSLTEPIIIYAEFKNDGVTPARKFECQGVVFIARLPLDDNETMKEPREEPLTGRHSKGAVWPGLTQNSDFASEDVLNPELIMELTAKIPKVAVYIAGEIRYRDMFYVKRKTQFCLYMNPEDTKHIIASAKQFGGTLTQVQCRFATSHILNTFT